MKSPPAIDVLVLDMSTLTLTRDLRSGRVRVWTCLQELVGEAVVPRAASDADAAYAAFEAALATGRVGRRGRDGVNEYLPVLLLNPHTGQIATGPAGHGVPAQASDGISVPAHGAPGQLLVDDGQVTVTVGGQAAAAIGDGFDLEAVLAAHA